MKIRKPIKKDVPRVYVTLKDAATKRSRGFTVEGASLDAVITRLEQLLNEAPKTVAA